MSLQDPRAQLPAIDPAAQAYLATRSEADAAFAASAAPAAPGTETAGRAALSPDIEASWAAHDFAFHVWETHRGVQALHPELEAGL